MIKNRNPHEDRPIMSVKYCLPVLIFHVWPKLTGHSPFSHLSHPNPNPNSYPNPKSNPNLILTLTLTLTLPNPNPS